MSWFTRHFGIDFIDFAIQFALTGFLAAAIDTTVHGPDKELLVFAVIGASIVVFGVRRRRALERMARQPVGLNSGQMAAARLEELEVRVSQLESAETRVAELEERLDFAERLLARSGGSLGAVASPAAPALRDGR
jgi:hypothetical protein